MRIYRRKFRSQTSDLWTNAATAVRAVREEKEKESEEKESEKRQSVKNNKVPKKVETSPNTMLCFSYVSGLGRVEK